jgi:adenylosuccinate synthase
MTTSFAYVKSGVRNVPATAVIGAQFGSEGKGKIVRYLSQGASWVVRTGGPNAGHTFDYGGQLHSVRMLPCGVCERSTRLAIAAGAVIDVPTLLKEVAHWQVDERRLTVDEQAVVITDDCVRAEADLIRRIGSTGQGVGAATAAKVLRSEGTRIARDVEVLSPFVTKVAPKLWEALDKRERVILEGTQGHGLSLHHGTYPYVTSRDTGAAALCSDSGLSPFDLDCVVLVLRPRPIRTGGQTGPLPNEVSWEVISTEAQWPGPLLEKSTVTLRTRRVARFDLNLVMLAIRTNKPTYLALNFADYLDYRNHGRTRYQDLTDGARRFIEWLENETGVRVGLIGTGPFNGDIIDRA